MIKHLIPRGTNEPWWMGIHLIALIGLGARLVVAFVSDYTYHPDELFQYLEQGHRIVFSYGYIPWEYRFGTRSVIVPGFISLVLSLCKVVSLDDPRIYVPVVKAVLCFFSISLVYASYVIGRSVASETAGRMAGVFTCLWYELIFFAHKPTPEMLATYCLMGALACAVSGPGQGKSLLLGLLAGLALAVRFQYLPVVFVIGLFVCLVWEKDELLKSGAGFLFVVAVAGCNDYLFWGKFFISYYNSYLFNKIYNVSTLFGTHKFYFYPAALAVTSIWVWCLVGVLSFARLKKTWLLVAGIAAVIVPHTFIPHKEYRFVLAAVPLLLLITAILGAEGIASARRILPQRFLAFLFVAGIFVLSGGGLFGKLPFQNKIYPEPLYGKQAILQAYTFLYQEPDLTAVAVLDTVVSPWCTGGYYYLHRNIPIYFPHHLTPERIGHHALTEIVSHVICSAATDEIPGFKPVVRIGAIEVRKQTAPPAQYLKPAVNTKEVLQPGVDDVYTPTIKRWF